MSDQPKRQDIEEILSRLDKSWQNLVTLLAEEQTKPAPQVAAPETGAPSGAPEWSGTGQTVAGHPSQPGPPDQDRPGPEEWGLPAGSPPQAQVNGDNGRARLKAPEMPGSTPVREASPARERLAAAAPETRPKKGWGQRIFNFLVLVLLAAALGGVAFLLINTHPGGGKVETEMLTIRGKNGVTRGWLGERDGLVSLCLVDKRGKSRIMVSLDEAEGPSLTLFDQLHQKRAEIKLGPGGEPRLSLIKDPGAPESPAGKAAMPEVGGTPGAVDQKGPSATPLPDPVAEKPVNPEAPAPVPAPAAPEAPKVEGPAAVVVPPEAKEPAPAPTIDLVGSSTSNKYHRPNCKWVKAIKPQKLVTFSSVKEAQEKGYIPCPVCKPPLK